MVIFCLTEHTTLVHVTIIVATHDVAHREFLIFEERIGSSAVVRRLHVCTIRVDVVSTAEEVGDAVVVRTHIRTEVNTGIYIKTVVQLLGKGRHQAIPTVLVVAHGHHHLRTAFSLFIEVLHLAIVKRTIGTAEVHIEFTICRAIPVCLISTCTFT